MTSRCWRTGPCAAVALFGVSAFLAGCGPSRPAYFQPHHYVVEHQPPAAETLLASADTLPTTISVAMAAAQPPIKTVTPLPQPTTVSRPAPRPLTSPLPDRHRNPDSAPARRYNNPFGLVSTEHVAPRHPSLDGHAQRRKTHPLALVALSLSAVAYMPLLVGSSGMVTLILGLALPLIAVLLGAASLTAINRNRDRYRGKGWAMGAIVLGTGVLGLALIAAAALSGTKKLWEK